MILAKFRDRDGVVRVGKVEPPMIRPLDLDGANITSLRQLLDGMGEQPDTPAMPALLTLVDSLTHRSTTFALDDVTLLPPIDDQEVWAAGVTYKRSQTARMEESETAASCYDRVYRSARPELFFKATAHRVRGPRGPLRIRSDAAWNVPEPEIALVINSRLELVGATIGNDMSSRDIEGDNPLYLPQAKVYNECCGLGPWIVTADAMLPRAQMRVDLVIRREGSVVFEGTTDADQMARTFEELIDWLGRDNSFPNGVILLTGTGIVPDSSFTLRPKDEIDITIAGIGILSNYVVQG